MKLYKLPRNSIIIIIKKTKKTDQRARRRLNKIYIKSKKIIGEKVPRSIK